MKLSFLVDVSLFHPIGLGGKCGKSKKCITFAALDYDIVA